MEKRIELQDNDQQKEFFLYDGDKKIGELTFSVKDGYMIISHTGVNVEYRGQGLAEKLVLKGIDYAKENNLKIRPYCSYVSGYMMKHPEYQDIL